MSTEENRILADWPAVMRLTGLGKATIRRRYRDGRLIPVKTIRLRPSVDRMVAARRIIEWARVGPKRGGAVLDEGRQNQSARG